MSLTIRDIREPSPQVMANGEEHGLIKVTANSVPDNEFKRFKEKDRPTMQSLYKDDSRMVTVTYVNRISRDKRYERPYCRWDGDPVLQYRFIPEQTYTVPYGLVKEVNEFKLKKRSDLLDPNTGKTALIDSDTESEHKFISAAAI